jgi:hypothetical protein
MDVVSVGSRGDGAPLLSVVVNACNSQQDTTIFSSFFFALDRHPEFTPGDTGLQSTQKVRTGIAIIHVLNDRRAEIAFASFA